MLDTFGNHFPSHAKENSDQSNSMVKSSKVETFGKETVRMEGSYYGGSAFRGGNNGSRFG
jgi:hypothetical protein